MSYEKAMRWSRAHPKGTRQPVLMSTGSGFWPAHSWLQGSFWPYLEACQAAGVKPLECEAFYRATAFCGVYRSPQEYVALTAAGSLGATPDTPLPGFRE
jgi:hypothetical protein